MANPGWDLEITSDVRELEAKITLLSNKLSDSNLSAWMGSELVTLLQTRVRDRFASEGDDATGSWDPLSPVTESIRASQGYGSSHPINVRTGDLRNFMTGNRGNVSATGGGVQIQFPNDPPNMELRDKLSTAQTGKQSPRTPMRPVIALGVTDFNEIMTLLSIHIMEGLI